MNFDLSDEQRAFQQTIDDYLAKECPSSRALAALDSDESDLSLWQGLMDLGVGAIVVPEDFGGLGLELLDLAVVADVVGRYAMPGPFLGHALGAYAIALAGNQSQKQRWLPDLATGKARATVAVAEGEERWMASEWRMKGDGGLTGTKTFVSQPEGADLIVVGLDGGQLGLLETEAEGMTLTALPTVDGGRGLWSLEFDKTPFEVLEGSADAGQRLCDAALVLLAADAFGGASHCVNMAVEYAKTREQFGRPIGQFQALKHQLANMALAVEPMVGLHWFCAHAFDHDPATASLAAALAKAHITDTYAKITRQTIEAHGGIGYTWEYGLHVWLKRAIFDRAYFGSPARHRARAADLAGW